MFSYSYSLPTFLFFDDEPLIKCQQHGKAQTGDADVEIAVEVRLDRSAEALSNLAR